MVYRDFQEMGMVGMSFGDIEFGRMNFIKKIPN